MHIEKINNEWNKRLKLIAFCIFINLEIVSFTVKCIKKGPRVKLSFFLYIFYLLFLLLNNNFL